MHSRFVSLLTFLALAVSLHAAPLSGTKSIGPTGNYASIGAAITDIQAQTVGGTLVLELQAAYVSTVETFPLVVPALNGASAVNTVTIRPASGAAGLSITSANTTAATLDLKGAKFVTFDGRPGGTGPAKQLTIANTSTTGVTVRFINEASGNALRFLTLQGVNASISSGTVVFSTTTGANGNDNNTIDTCDLRDGASTPANAIYSVGSTGTIAQNNSGNTVSNCNIFNFYSATSFASGIQLGNGSTDWTITGNSFYQTATRAAAPRELWAIWLNNPVSGNNFTVTGNFIGGSAPNAGGTAWTTTGTTAAYLFQGIRLNVGTTTPSSVQGNTIKNITWTTSHNDTALPGVWSGIYVQAGNVNIGTVTGNTIGSGTGTGSIAVTTSGTGGTTFGIGSTSSGTVAIANNTIGSITTNGTDSTVSARLAGLQVTAGANTITGNTVGSTTTAISLNAATSSTSFSAQRVTGILSSSTTGAIITGNTVANLNNNYAGTANGQVLGIVASAGVNTISVNTVCNLSTTSQTTGSSGDDASAVGISQTSAAAGQTVSQNTVHSLVNTAATAAVTVTGVYFTGQTTGTNIIARNLVHSLAVSSTSAASTLSGMYFAAWDFTAQNNMIRVGLDATGASTAGVSSVYGIVDSGPLRRNYYHNSVYVGGTQTSGTSSTAAYQKSGVSSGDVLRIQNNLLVNARSNNGATSKHYAITGSIFTGGILISGGNLFLASGSGGVLGSFGGIDRTTLAAWQAATGQDATSEVANPRFANPTGNAATFDLHLQASSPAEGKGISIAAVTDDFDGQIRSTLTPVDVGADAGDFTWIDGSAPAIGYPLLTSGSTANRMLTGWAAITDNSGSVSDGASAPRLYFKKSTDADVFGTPNDATGNGWKYVIASGSGPYTFTLDYSRLNGGSVTAGDTIQYFVVAQDAANNFASNPIAATASANPPVQNLSAEPGAGVNSFSILPSISGAKTVGSGGDYPSLSGPGGLFAALNGAVVTGNVVVNITGDLTEDGSVTLDEFKSVGFPADTYTLTIQPDSATMRTVSGNVYGNLITLNGADRVTFDGRFGGTGRYLTFRNTSIANLASTVLFVNGASNNTLRNCIVEGSTRSTTLGVIAFVGYIGAGNHNNLITGCQVRDVSTSTIPNILISASGDTAAPNSGNTITNNELFNFNYGGIGISSTGNASWTLSDNNIYDVKTSTNTVSIYGISMQAGGTNVVAGNFIHDLLSTGSDSYGIIFSGRSATTIARNRITALNLNAAQTTVNGIYTFGYPGAGSTLNIVNNQITLNPAGSVSAALYGFSDSGYSANVVNAFYNSIIIGGTESGTRSSWASYRNGRNGATIHTARNNLFLNLRTGGGVSHYAAGSEVNGGSYTVSHNVYAGTGTTPASFMDFSGAINTPGPVTFATWQSLTGDTNSQAGVAGSGSFISAIFANTANGDLHLVPGGNVLVNNTGTPIAGVTTDFDSEARQATQPYIGADELVTLTPFQQWATDNGLPLSPAANGGANLLNFAFGLNADGSSTGVITVMTGVITQRGTPTTRQTGTPSGVDFKALFGRRKNSGLTYTVQFSADLSGWENNAVTPAVIAEDGLIEACTVPYPFFLSDGQKARFFRVSVQ